MSASLIGQRVVRADALEKALGSAIFGVDVKLPGMLHAKLVRSTYAHAHIRKIDTSKAEARPETYVVTHRDAPAIRYGLVVKDQRLFASSKTVYHGDIVAAVAAPTEEEASDASALVEVDYDPLTVYPDIDAAIGPNAVRIHDELPRGSPAPLDAPNVSSYTVVKRGDVNQAFERADLVLEETYETQSVHQSYLEPHAAVAKVDPTGKITVWTSTQAPHLIRGYLAEVLNVPLNRINVIGTFTGGGFGGKLLLTIEAYCVLLAMKAGRPVKMVLTREEEFTATNPRPACKFWLKSGVSKNGLLLARQARCLVDTGAFETDGPFYANIAAIQLVGPYVIPNVHTEGYTVYTNTTATGAFRSPGTAEPNFAVESHMDMLAAKLALDPLEFRLKNVWDEGSMTATGQVLGKIGLKAVLREAADRINWEKQRGPNRGVGIACGTIPSMGPWASGAYVKINEDGSVGLIAGVSDTGTGAAYAGLRMIVAQELGVALDTVTLVNTDTDTTPYDGGAQGSRTTYGGGSAALQAAQDALHQLFALAARVLGAQLGELDAHAGRIFLKTDPGKSVSIADLAKKSTSTGGPILGRGSFVEPYPAHDKHALEGFAGFPSLPDPNFVAHAAEVSVDPETGKVTVDRYVAIHDVGRAINPLGVEGQIEGGTVQGIGFAQFEELSVDSMGLTLNPNFADYKLPTAADVPRVESGFLEGYLARGPYGAKGVGEANIVPPAAAIGNAIFRAIGSRVYRAPLTPERVLRALRKGRKRTLR